MKKSWLALFSLLIVLVFIIYMIYDTVRTNGDVEPAQATILPDIPDQWEVSETLLPGEGNLTSVAVSGTGGVFLGGDSFVTSFDASLKKRWTIKTEGKITALCTWGDTLYAATQDVIYLYDNKGKQIEEWGPFEDNSIITSVAANSSHVAFADAGNRMVFVLENDGRVKSMMGQSGDDFIIPSPYFDVALSKDELLYVSNPGKRRIETRKIDGEILRFFGSPGLAAEAFCGCCNPSHFALVPQGFLTAEKGINRIKLLNSEGGFIEFVSSDEKFTASVPLDIAFAGDMVYAANPADSKLYIFKRKQQEK